MAALKKITHDALEFHQDQKKTWAISFAVIILHILLFAPVLFFEIEAKKAPQKILVRTISLQESKKQTPVAFTAQQTPQPQKELKKDLPSPSLPQEKKEPIKNATDEEPSFDDDIALVQKEEQEEEQEEEAPVAPTPKEKEKKEEKKTAQKKPESAKKITKKPDAQEKKSPQQPKKEVSKKNTPRAPEIKKKQTEQKPKESAKNSVSKTNNKKENTQKDTSALSAEMRQKQAKQNQERQNQARKEQAQKEQLLQDALAYLDSSASRKAECSSQGVSSDYKAPSRISSLSSDGIVSITSQEAGLQGKERTYYEELVTRLKLHLKMPEYGEVKLKLTLNRQGKVLKVAITSAKSTKNRQAIENFLPTLTFPSFGTNFSGENEHTFLLSLNNDLKL